MDGTKLYRIFHNNALVKQAAGLYSAAVNIFERQAAFSVKQAADLNSAAANFLKRQVTDLKCACYHQTGKVNTEH